MSIPALIAGGIGFGLAPSGLFTLGVTPGPGAGAIVTANIETAIAAVLAGSPGVIALVVDRIYPDDAPQNADYPYAVYHQAEESPIMTFSGPVSTSMATMVIECWGASKSAAKLLRNAVRNALNGFTSRAGPEDIKVLGTFLHGESDSFLPPLHGKETRAYGCELTLKIWHHE